MNKLQFIDELNEILADLVMAIEQGKTNLNTLEKAHKIAEYSMNAGTSNKADEIRKLILKQKNINKNLSIGACCFQGEKGSIENKAKGEQEA